MKRVTAEQAPCVTPQTTSTGTRHLPVACNAVNGRALFPIIRTFNDRRSFEGSGVRDLRCDWGLYDRLINLDRRRKFKEASVLRQQNGLRGRENCKAREHNGIDLPAALGAPVFASYHGRIETISNDYCGLGVKLHITAINNRALDWTHETGTAVYCHLSSILVTDGARVARGDLIGHIGKTGNARSTKPHLHFALTLSSGISPACRLSNGATNPYCVPFDFKLPITSGSSPQSPPRLAKR